MTYWIYENGIGEERAALISGGSVQQARIERKNGGIRPGAVVMARLVRKIGAGKRAIARLSTGEDAIISAFPKQLTEGQELSVRITRAAITEKGPQQSRHKYALGKGANTGVTLIPSPSLLQQIEQDGIEVKQATAHGPDLLAEAGWEDLMHEAHSGHVAFAGGSLEIAPTPAMTVIDVDGESAPRPLALEAAKAVAAAVHRLDIGGAIGIDFPALPAKSDRGDIVLAFEKAMHGPYERTAVNGFGFMQVVRKYERPSLVQQVQDTPDLTALLTLLRRAERDRGTGPMTLHLTPAMRTLWDRHADLQAQLAQATGRTIRIAPESACTREAASLSGSL